MLNSHRPLRKDASDPGGLTLELFRPLRIVFDNPNAAVQWLQLSDVCGAYLFLGQSATNVRWLLQIKMEELVEGTSCVAAERRPVDEAVLTIELEGGLESRAGAGLQREARIASSTGLGDYVIENRRSDSLS